MTPFRQTFWQRFSLEQRTLSRPSHVLLISRAERERQMRSRRRRAVATCVTTFRVLGAEVDRSERLLFAWVALTVIALLAFSIVSAAPAATDPNVGYDISYPQCNGAFPRGGAFGIGGG